MIMFQKEEIVRVWGKNNNVSVALFKENCLLERVDSTKWKAPFIRKMNTVKGLTA